MRTTSNPNPNPNPDPDPNPNPNQDDAHIFCLPEQLTDEITGVLDLTEEILSKFGFTEYEINLSNLEPDLDPDPDLDPNPNPDPNSLTLPLTLTRTPWP